MYDLSRLWLDTFQLSISLFLIVVISFLSFGNSGPRLLSSWTSVLITSLLSSLITFAHPIDLIDSHHSVYLYTVSIHIDNWTAVHRSIQSQHLPMYFINLFISATAPLYVHSLQSSTVRSTVTHISPWSRNDQAKYTSAADGSRSGMTSWIPQACL